MDKTDQQKQEEREKQKKLAEELAKNGRKVTKPVFINIQQASKP